VDFFYFDCVLVRYLRKSCQGKSFNVFQMQSVMLSPSPERSHS